MAMWTLVEHSLPERKTLTLTLLLLPFIYYGIKVSKWLALIRRLGKQIDKLPGLPRHWLYGNLHQFPGPGEAGIEFILKNLVSRYRMYKFWIGPLRPTAVACHPDTIKEVLKHTERKPLMGGYRFVIPWLGNGLLLSYGPVWFRNRKLMTPAFHFDVLKPYMEVNNAAADALVRNLHAKASASGGSVEIFQPVSLCTLQVIFQCAFSYQDDVQRQDSNHPYVIAVLALAKLVVKRAFSPPKHLDLYYNRTSQGKDFYKQCDYVHKVADDVIKSRQKALKYEKDIHSKRCKDFLDILLLARDEEGNGLSDLEIRQEVDTFLFEGHDTTASGISYALYHLARHPVHQKKAQEEVDDLLAGRDTPDITWEDVKCLPYLTMCVKESMRLSPPVPAVGREAHKSFTVAGVTFPPRAEIIINILGLHHNPEVWGDDHNDFRPERFLPENMSKMDSHAFLPFSAGPRNCIGQNFAMHELKVVVAKVLYSFNLSVDESWKVERLPEMILRTKNGMKLICKPRHAAKP